MGLWGGANVRAQTTYLEIDQGTLQVGEWQRPSADRPAQSVYRVRYIYTSLIVAIAIANFAMDSRR